MPPVPNSVDVLAAGPNRTDHEWRNNSAFAALTTSGEIRAWGHPAYGGTLPAPAKEAKGVKQIFSSASAFAALTHEGKVITWGADGGDSRAVADRLSRDIRKISSTKEAFAAIDCRGGVTAWGVARYGGDIRDIADQLQEGVVDVISTDGAFAALKRDNSVVVWGDEFSGGVRGKDGINIRTNVKATRATGGAFAFIHHDDTVSTLGYWNHGGVAEGQAAAALASGQVKDVFSSEFTFAALLKNGTVVTWGVGPSGGDSSAVSSELVGVKTIVGNRNAFAAIRHDGAVVSWGISGDNYTAIADQLSSGVVEVIASDQAFAALKSDGSVKTWGSPKFGADSSAVAGQISKGVVEITATDTAFAARKADGSVVTWGDLGGDSSSVSQQLSGDVIDVVATGSAFAALKKDGTVVTWGSAENGGSSLYASGPLTNIATLSDVFTDASIGSEFSACQAKSDNKTDLNPPPTDGIILSSPGKGKMLGREGADQFLFGTPDRFGKKGADKIINFNATEGDQLILSTNSLPGIKTNPPYKFESVNNKKQLKKMAKQDVDLIYLESKGQLFYDGNGAKRGFGNKLTGGLLSILVGAPELTGESISIV